MKAGWQVQPLQSFCNNFKQDIVDGPFGSELQRKDYIDEGVPVLKIQNVKPFAVEFKKMDYVSSTKFQELRRHSYKTGDIVMTKLGAPLGASAIVREGTDGVIVADLVRIRAQRINTEYLCYHLNSPGTSSFVNSMQKGTTRPRVTISVVRELPIAVPSTSEQQRIVAILDDAFDGIAIIKANAEKNLENVRALFASHVQLVFNRTGSGWTTKTLNQVSQNLDSKRIPITKSDRKPGKYRYYGASGIVDYVDSYIFDGDTLLVSEDGANLLARSTPIAFSVSGKYWVNNHAHILKFENMATQRCVELYLESIPLDDYITGAAQPKLNQQALNSIPISIPNTIGEQQKVVDEIETLSEQTQRLESIYQQKLAALAELKKSLLHQAFSGNL
jgi:type I restriction enzyme, S subunit